LLRPWWYGSVVMNTAPTHTRVLFYLLGIRPRPEWRQWAEGAVTISWPWIIGGRVGLAVTVGAVLVYLRSNFLSAHAFGTMLILILVLVPLAVLVNNGERTRRREIARIQGTRRTGPAWTALTSVSLVSAGVLLLTDGGRLWSGPMMDRLQWALVVATLLTGIWALYERRVRDRDLADRSRTQPDSPR